MCCLGRVQCGDQCVEIGECRDIGGVACGEVADAFLAAGDCQQFAVERLIPVPAESVFGEGEVECDAVAVALEGADQSTVTVVRG